MFDSVSARTKYIGTVLSRSHCIYSRVLLAPCCLVNGYVGLRRLESMLIFILEYIRIKYNKSRRGDVAFQITEYYDDWVPRSREKVNQFNGYRPGLCLF
jgi:hypothetical protein